MKQRPKLENVSLEDAVRAGIALHKQGHLEQAELFYESVLQEDPDQADALHFLGVMRHQTGLGEEAAELIAKAIELVPDDAGMWMNYGNVLFEEDRRDEAEAAYREAIRLAPDYPDAHCNLGALIRGQEKFEEAKKHLERAIELDPNHGEAHCNLGNVLRDLRDLDGAAACYARSVDLGGHQKMRSKAAANLASVLRRAGKPEQAIKVLKQWVAQDPGSPTAHHMLAAMSQEGVPGRAEDAYVKELFDGFAKSFDTILENLHYRAPLLMGELLERIGLPEGDELDILDLGCGTGLSGEVVADRAATLVGMDISENMLAKARRRGCYDELVEAEITSYLKEEARQFDLIMAVDALCYFGALDEVMQNAFGCLKQGGQFCFTVEKTAEAASTSSYRLEGHGRYTHQQSYLIEEAALAGLDVVQIQEAILRLESGDEVHGFVVALQRPKG